MIRHFLRSSRPVAPARHSATRSKSSSRSNRSLLESLESRVLLSATYYVDLNSPGATPDGTSWATAFTNPQTALAAAIAGDQILVADGTYFPTAGTDRTATFQLKNGVSLLGGYAGNGAPDPNARNAALYPTVLSGDIGIPGAASDNSYNVVTATALTLQTTLDGVTITGGNANAGGAANSGGGLLDNHSLLLLSHVTFSANFAGYGGALVSSGPNAIALTDCTFSGNSASNFGGALLLAGSASSLTNCTFIDNTCTTGSGGALSGGALLTDCVFLGNSAKNGGGAYINVLSQFVNCVFDGNTASSLGGGVESDLSSVNTFSNCTFAANFAGVNDGGAIYNAKAVAPPALKNCILWGNGNDPAAFIFTVSNSDIEGGFAGTGNLNADPQFVRTPWAGPDGRFGTADDDFGDLHLRPGSPALNAGSNAAVPAGITTDVAGNPRMQNGTVDLGAYEGSFAAPATKIIYVDQSATGANTGISWSDAFASLQSAIAAATDGDTIRIAGGTYSPTISSDRTLSFVLRNSVAIDGGYAGHAAANPDVRDPAATPTILSGDIGIPGATSDNSYHVVTGLMLGTATFLDGLTITAGNANGSGSQANGGGMYNLFSSPMLNNISFTFNSAVTSSGFGGGLYVAYSYPTLSNCTFAGNTAYAGGGMYTAYSTLTLSGSAFTQNQAVVGGAIYSTFSSLALTSGNFHLNSATISTTSPSTTGGGAIFAGSSALSLANCNFNGNAANGAAGGALYMTLSSAALLNCTLTSNTAGYGGGMASSESTVTLSNAVFAANYAHNDGGALYNAFGKLSLISSSVGGNMADGQGAAIYNASTTGLTLANSIVWGNGAGSIYSTMGAAAITFSDIEGGYTGAGNISADPLFVRSPWTGSDGVFGTSDDDAGDLRLRTGSPAVDAGSNAAAAGLATDLAGNPRIGNGTVDMGAYEGTVAVAPARILYVDAAAAGANSGASWSDAFHDLQSALLLATDGDVIRIAHGTYLPTAGADQTLSFALRNNVAVYGGYAGSASLTPDARDPAATPTILSGEIGLPGTATDNTFHIVTATRVGAATILDGVTVTGAAWDHVFVDGAMYISSANLTLRNSIFTNNANAGIASNQSSPLISNSTISASARFGIVTAGGTPCFTACVVTGNTGAGMYTNVSSPSLVNCTFSANSGSGIDNEFSTVTLTGCTFSLNSAANGGAILNHGLLFATDSLFQNNSARTNGGAIYSDASTSFLTHCTFITNSVLGSGGAVYLTHTFNSTASPVFTACTFEGNSAGGGGGAIANSTASPVLINCVLAGNTAQFGGAIHNYHSSPSLFNCTIAGNIGTAGKGAAIYSEAITGIAPTDFENCIIWGNGANAAFGSDNFSRCDVQFAVVGGGIIASDPQFVRNPSPGDYGDLHLLPTSPCIDAGNNAANGLAGITTDLDGRPRFIDTPTTPDTGTGVSPIVDMGAYETNTISLFYRNSSFDTSDPAAIALDKTPLLPGQTASFANYTSFDRGINGIMIDLPGLHTGISAADFTFALGNDSAPANWPGAPVPTAITASSGDTTGTWTHLQIIWPDHAIQNQWLQVTLAANADTGLAAAVTFYVGNTPGESGDSPADAKVNATDQLAPRYGATPAALITNPYDYNRDGKVDAADKSVAVQNYTYFLNELHLITAPSAPSSPTAASASVPESSQPLAFPQLTAAIPTGPLTLFNSPASGSSQKLSAPTLLPTFHQWLVQFTEPKTSALTFVPLALNDSALAVLHHPVNSSNPRLHLIKPFQLFTRDAGIFLSH